MKQPTNPESESPKAWAYRVWWSWTPTERAEVAGAMQIVMDSVRGAGDGTEARKRRLQGRNKNYYDGGNTPHEPHV